MIKNKMLSITVMIFLFSASNLFPASATWLSITVQTNKTIYNVSETVEINGTVIFDGSPLSNTLVAIEVDDRTIPILYRTINTGEDPPGPFKVEMLDVYLGDSYQNPVTNAKRGSTYWIWLVYKNNEVTPVQAALTFTIIDPNNSPILALIVSLGEVPVGGPWYTGYQWTVPSDTQLGTAIVYGNAFTDYPRNGGTPHSPEKSSTFNIVSTLSTINNLEPVQKSPPQVLQEEASYYLNFTIPENDARLGNYTVYATVTHWGLVSQENTIFEVILVGDVNGDGFVNAKDAVLLGSAFGSQEGDPEYNRAADLNNDGFCNAKDAIIIGANFGNSGR